MPLPTLPFATRPELERYHSSRKIRPSPCFSSSSSRTGNTRFQDGNALGYLDGKKRRRNEVAHNRIRMIRNAMRFLTISPALSGCAFIRQIFKMQNAKLWYERCVISWKIKTFKSTVDAVSLFQLSIHAGLFPWFVINRFFTQLFINTILIYFH